MSRKSQSYVRSQINVGRWEEAGSRLADRLGAAVCLGQAENRVGEFSRAVFGGRYLITDLNDREYAALLTHIDRGDLDYWNHPRWPERLRQRPAPDPKP